MINQIALKVQNLFPMPNTGGTGLGGLTNNYTRNENRTVDRQNYDLKVNFNRNTGPPDLGQVQLHGRGGGRPDQLPRSRSERDG